MRTAVLAALLLALPLVAAAEEQVSLAWQLEVGDRYEVEKSNLTRTTTVTHAAGQEQSEAETSKSVLRHLLEVLAVEDDGRLSLRFTTLSGALEKSGSQTSYKLTMRRSETGVKHVEVDAPGSGEQAEATRMVLESLGGDLLDLQIEFEMTRRGDLVSSRIQGTLFENLPADNEVMVLVGRILKEILPREELAAAATADGFPILPAGAVAVGTTWPVKRSIDLMGLSLRGEGTGRLLAVEDGTARLEEMQTYDVDPSGLGTRMERMFGVIYDQMGLPLSVKLSFDPVEPLEVRCESRFDVEDGCAQLSTWETMKVALDGAMEITLRGEVQHATMSVTSEADVKVVWKKLP